MAAAVDDLSNGRLTLGLGAGWQEREHQLFGFDLLNSKDRFDRFEEGVQVVTGFLKSDTPTSFDGKYYQIRQAVLLPRPQRPGGPKILIGGSGLKRTLPLAARYADEWNCIYTVPNELSVLNKRLDNLLKGGGRDPGSLKRSMMTGCYFGKNENALREKISESGRSFDELRTIGVIVGNPAQVKQQLHELEEAGLQRVMLQWLDLDDLESLEALAKAIL
jgi:alkanesulfonate monooxygenase SsuD/methylene tetrahydromethanopterin reductase-like flavin-dependent oxidoreductase (luciferase family)